jgi:nucleoside-diphosphate-sugar epimerase
MNAIALTGATSMLGVALIKQCIRHSIKVIAFVRPDSPRMDRLPDSELITIVNCGLNDLANEKLTKNDLGSPEIFYHFGWDYTNKQERYICEKQIENINFTLDAVHLAQRLGCKKFIGAGSQAEYGRSDSLLTGETPVDPEIAYGIAKYAAGKFAKIECEKQNLAYSWVRILSVYGIHDNEDTLIKTFILSCKNNTPMSLGPCTHIWDYLYEDDAGRAFLSIGEKGQNGKVYCLGSGNGKPLKEYLEIMRNIINPQYTPQYGEITYEEKSVKYLCADISELTRDTGWKPEVSFEDGIKKIIALLAP